MCPDEARRARIDLYKSLLRNTEFCPKTGKLSPKARKRTDTILEEIAELSKQLDTPDVGGDK